MEAKRSDKYKVSKLKIFLIILITIIVLVVSLITWSRYVSTNGLSVNEYKVVNSNLPTTFNGLKIVHFSDVHYGTTIDKKNFNKIIEQINLINPDLVVFTGDLIDKDTKITEKLIKEITESLSKINSKLGKYSIKGEQDYESDSFIEIMQNSDFIILDNSYDLIYNENGEAIYIGGLSSSIKKNIDINKTLDYFNIENVNQNIFSIMLMHEPDNIDDLLKSKNINLVLAGHNHGGQIRLPFLGGIISMKDAKKYNDRYYKLADTNYYISYGLGTTNYPYRLLNRPSINFYRLYNK